MKLGSHIPFFDFPDAPSGPEGETETETELQELCEHSHGTENGICPICKLQVKEINPETV